MRDKGAHGLHVCGVAFSFVLADADRKTVFGLSRTPYGLSDAVFPDEEHNLFIDHCSCIAFAIDTPKVIENALVQIEEQSNDLHLRLS